MNVRRSIPNRRKGIRWLAGVAALLGALALCASAAAFSGGNGTAEAPYRLANAADLAAFAEKVNAGDADYAKAHYRLADDIVLSGTEWTPIGTENTPFAGTFDGNGYYITDFRITRETAFAGLFGVTENAEIFGLALAGFTADVTSSGSVSAGALVGKACASDGGQSFIHDCMVYGSVHASSDASAAVGGLVGTFASERGTLIGVYDCVSRTDVSAESSVNAMSGGAVGTFRTYSAGEGGIRRCVCVGKVKAQASAQGSAFAGGVTGYLFGEDPGWVGAAALMRAGADVSGCIVDSRITAGTDALQSYAGAVCGKASQFVLLSDSYRVPETTVSGKSTNTDGTRSGEKRTLVTASFLSGTLGFDTVGVWMPQMGEYPVIRLLTSGKCGKDVKYIPDIEAETLVITGYGKMTDFTGVWETPWQDVGAFAKNLAVRDGVTGIGTWAFAGMERLASVTLPPSLTDIGAHAFDGCKGLADVYFKGTRAQWKTVSVGSGNDWLTDAVMRFDSLVTYDAAGGKNAPEAQYKTYGNAITLSTVIPTREGGTFLGWTSDGGKTLWRPGATYKEEKDLALTAVWQMRQVTLTLYGCGGLPEKNVLVRDYGTSVILPTPDNGGYYVLDGWAAEEGGRTVKMANSSFTFTEDTTLYAVWKLRTGTCGTGLRWTLRADGTLVISGSGAITDFKSSSASPWYAFRTLIKRIVFDGAVTRIGDYAFYRCGETAAPTFPDSLVSIGKEAFYGCNAMASVILPDGVTEVGRGAFSHCEGLTEAVLGEKLTALPEKVFEKDTSLARVTFADGLLFIYDEAFSGCEALTGLVFPEKLLAIGVLAFQGCGKLKDITVPAGVTSLGFGAFYGCEATESISLPVSVTSIGESAFSGCPGTAVVSYAGTRREFREIVIGSDNDILTEKGLRCVSEIIFDGCGGENVPETVRKTYGEPCLLPQSEPKRDTYAFAGWATEPAGEPVYQPGDAYRAELDVTLYAVWMPIRATFAEWEKTDGGTVCTVRLQHIPVGALLVAAGYDKNGRLTDVRLTTHTADTASESLTLAENVCTVKLLTLSDGGTLVPLTEAKQEHFGF